MLIITRCTTAPCSDASLPDPPCRCSPRRSPAVVRGLCAREPAVYRRANKRRALPRMILRAPASPKTLPLRHGRAMSGHDASKKLQRTARRAIMRAGNHPGRPMIKRYSDHAVNERTFPGLVRTAIAVMAFGFVIERFESVSAGFDAAA